MLQRKFRLSAGGREAAGVTMDRSKSRLEVIVKRNALGYLLVAVLLCFGTACRKNEAASPRTETMTPATPPPASVNATDTVMTQTTDVGEDRPSSEGGVLTENDTATTVRSTKPAPHPKPPAKPHR